MKTDNKERKMKMSNRLATVVISIMVVATLLPIASLEAGTGVNDPRISTDKSNYSVGDNVIVTVSNTLNGSIRMWYCLLDTRNSPCTNDKKWIMYKSSETRHYFGPMSDAWANKWLKIIAENTTRSTWSNEIYMQISPRSGFNPTWPTSGGNITAADKYPSSGKTHSCRYSHCIDIGVGIGTPVYATEAGTVTEVKNTGNTSFGKFIVIKHNNGAYSLYAHLSVQSVSVGQTVSRGQQIGKSGNSGGSTGAHLHFEISSSTRDRLADYFPGR